MKIALSQKHGKLMGDIEELPAEEFLRDCAVCMSEPWWSGYFPEPISKAYPNLLAYTHSCGQSYWLQFSDKEERELVLAAYHNLPFKKKCRRSIALCGGLPMIILFILSLLVFLGMLTAFEQHQERILESARYNQTQSK